MYEDLSLKEVSLEQQIEGLPHEDFEVHEVLSKEKMSNRPRQVLLVSLPLSAMVDYHPRIERVYDQWRFRLHISKGIL